MTIKELIEALKTLPEGSFAPIVRGRREAEVFASLPAGTAIPKGWVQAAQGLGYYPEGTIRVRWVGGDHV